MTLIHRHSPLADVVTARDAMERHFDERSPRRPLSPWNAEHEEEPALDLYSTEEAVVARVALPGVRPATVDVSVIDDVVTVRGSWHGEEAATEAGLVHRELGRGPFSRTFELPAAVDGRAAEVTFDDGLLTLTIPRIGGRHPDPA